MRRFFPAAAFLGGFVWDALTLGREIRPVDLWILLLYTLAAAGLLVLIGRRVEFRFSRYLNTAFQFLIGGIVSALVIFYFLSSSDVPGYILVGLLVALLVGNEFLEQRYGQLTLGWTLFAFACAMLLNFALPHLFRSISPLWFYLSSLLAIGSVFGLKMLARESDASLVPAVVVMAILIGLYALNAIPPVPLVKRTMLLAHSIERRGGDYVARVDRRGLLKETVRRRAGEPVYCFTSIFLPTGIETTIYHRWLYHDGTGWKTLTRVGFPIRGGRRDGYRGYTVKRNLPAGEWKVVAESESGQRIGILRFRVIPDTPRKLTRITL